MSNVRPYSTQLKRSIDKGRSVGAKVGLLGYGALLVGATIAGAAPLGTTLAMNMLVLIGGLAVSGVVGAMVGSAIAGGWSGVADSPTLSKYDTPLVPSEDLGLVHSVQLSHGKDHVAYVHEGRVVEARNGRIEAIDSYKDHIDNVRAEAPQSDIQQL